MVFSNNEDPIESALPGEVVRLRLTPDVTLLTTAYIFHMGRTVGQEMAASAGFPVFPRDDKERGVLLSALEPRGLPSLLALGRLRTLERIVAAAPPAEAPEAGLTAEERLLAAAIFNQDARTEAQSRKLSKTLSDISGAACPHPDLEYWAPGIEAIIKLTRLVIEAVIPTKIGTMDNLLDPASGLRQISTLGGALFLGHSIGVLTGKHAAAPHSPYAVLGGRIAKLTEALGRGRVKVPDPAEVEKYTLGLQAFAARGDSVFAIEHPFHFRVLLEVLSDENRRYPAEPVLNVAALRDILHGIGLDHFFWDHVIWSRRQLPVVENLLRPPERTRAEAYVQHYAAFGRTPHTSSFTHLNYEMRSLVGNADVADAWPEAFQGDYCVRPLQNMPNSVCHVLDALNREQSLGRLWRGTPEEDDLRWLGGQLVEWNGDTEDDDALVDRIWDSNRWTAQTFPIDALAEIRVGAWLLEALRLRLAALALPTAPAGGQPALDRERTDLEYRAAGELRCVMEIMAYFSADYLSGDEDSLLRLKTTLGRLRDSDWFTDLGPKLGAKLDGLERSLDALGGQLEVEVRRAREALSGDGE
jgi:hypothetical protein